METIEDIVRDMREFANRHWMHDEGQNIGQFADRIEAEAKATVRTDNTETLHNLLDENARLRSALRQVVNCELNPIVSCALGIPNCELWLAIQECKRIFNESEAK